MMPSVDACGPVGGAEGVVDIDFAELGELLAEGGVVLLFLGVIAEVFKQQDLAGGGQHRFDFGPTQSGAKATGLPSSSARRMAAGFNDISDSACPWGGEVGGEDEPSALFEGILDARKGGLDAFVGGDFLAAGSQGHVEIDAHEDTLAFEVEVADG